MSWCERAAGFCWSPRLVRVSNGQSDGHPCDFRALFLFKQASPVSAGASAHLVDEVFLDAQPTIGMN